MIKVSQCTQQKLGELIIYLLSMIGIKETPTDVQAITLIDYIKGSLCRFSMEDFKLAFTLFCDGKLDEQREHFQVLSPMYLGRVMESYSRYRFKYINQTKEEPEAELNEAKRMEIMKTGCLKAFENYKKTKSIIDFGNVKYIFLEKQGIIQYPLIRKKEMIEQARREINEENERVKSTTSINIIIKAEADQVVTRAREIALKVFFDDLIEMDIELSEKFE